MTDRRLSEQAQRYLDGEPHGALTPDERDAADRLAQAILRYADGLRPPDAVLDDAVLAQLSARRSPARRRARWRWLIEPQTVRLRPVWVPALAAALLLVAWVALRVPGREAAVAPTRAFVSDTVFVRFELLAPEASVMALAGSFNGWSPETHRLVRDERGVWSATIALPLGEHEYQFVVDGERWIPDPGAYAQVDDGFGGVNSVIVVGPRGVVRS